jgi:hypothetical protein
MAHRDILRRRAILVAFGVEADINVRARLGGSVVIDPKRPSLPSGSLVALILQVAMNGIERLSIGGLASTKTNAVC